MQQNIHLGLDLKGGTHLILQVQVNDAVNADSRSRRRAPEGRAAHRRTFRYGEITKPDPAAEPRSSSRSRALPPESSGDLRRIVQERLPNTT